MALALALGWSSPSHAEWFTSKTRHFIVYGDGGQKTLGEFAGKLEKFDAMLRTLTGTPPDRDGAPVRVFVLSNEAKVKALARRKFVAGFYNAGDRFAYAVLSKGKKDGAFDLGAEEVLFHEYAHHFMLHHFPAAYPAWYVEGFAEFFSVVHFPKDGSVEFGRIPMVRVPTLVMDSVYPLKQLLDRTTDGLGLREGDRYYGTAWLLTHYMHYDKERGAQLQRYLNDTAKGVPGIKPDSYFTGGVEGLEKDLKAYMRRRLMASKFTPPDKIASDFAVTPVDAAKGALMEDELRLIAGVPEEERAALAAGMRERAARFPDSAHAAALLGEVERLVERNDAALAAADRAVALDPNMARAHSLRADILLDRANDSDKDEDWKAARSAIIKANRADTEDPVPLVQFYRLARMQGEKVSDIAYDGLYKAFTLLPQHEPYRFMFADAVADRGEYKAASALLDPLAFSPHDSGMREYAIRKKAEYDAGAKGRAEEQKEPVKAGA